MIFSNMKFNSVLLYIKSRECNLCSMYIQGPDVQVTLKQIIIRIHNQKKLHARIKKSKRLCKWWLREHGTGNSMAVGSDALNFFDSFFGLILFQSIYLQSKKIIFCLSIARASKNCIKYRQSIVKIITPAIICINFLAFNHYNHVENMTLRQAFWFCDIHK